MPGGVGEHRLQPFTRRALPLAALLGPATRSAKAVDQLIAGPLERGDVDEPSGLGGGYNIALAGGSGGLRVRRKAPLEAGDLITEGTAGGRLVATLEGGDVLRPGGRGLKQAEVRSLGVAAGVEDAGQVAGVDAGITGGACRRRRKFLDRG